MNEIYEALQKLILEIALSGTAIILAGLIVGFVVKKWVPDEACENKLIPTINTILGGILGVVIPGLFPNTHVVVSIIYGAMCGVFASLLYDKIVQPVIELVNRKTNE